jgi:hypothetical protein
MREHRLRLGIRDPIGFYLGVVLLAISPGCSDDPAGVERDSPMIDIVFPTAEVFDRDGDGLVDIEVRFEDMGSGIDIESLEVLSNRPLGPAGQGGTDLLGTFEIMAMDPMRVVLEETTDAILPGGDVTLVVRVRDNAGNLGEALRAIRLPFGAFHRLLEGPDVLADPVAIEVLPDGTQGFLLAPTFGTEIVPFNPFTFEVLPGISTGGGIEGLADGLFEPSTERLYSSSFLDPRLSVIDVRSLAPVTPIPIAAPGVGIERGPSGLLYVGLGALRASVAVVDPTQGIQIRVVETDVTNPLNPDEPARIVTPRFLSDEAVIYGPMPDPPGGVLVIDNPSGVVRSVIDINPSATFLGFPLESVLDKVRGRLYLTDFNGLAEVDLINERLERRIEAVALRPKFLSLSPSGARIFVSAGSTANEIGESWLVDVGSFEILERFPVAEPRPQGENKSAFRPDGQLIFVARGDDIAVYLNRE